jgi:hypothetical protein
MFRNLKTGWNHIVLPIDRTAAKGDVLWAFRLFHTNIKVTTGEYFIMDDVRIMNEIATLTVLPERTKAKDATLAIREIPALDVITVEDQDLVTAAAEAYAAVADDYKSLVQNAGAIAAAQAKIDELNTPVVNYTFDGTYFYEDGVLVEGYQVIDYNGCVYFVSDYNEVAKDCTLYLGEAFIDEPGYYTFDEEGRAVDFSGIYNGYAFIHNELQTAYQVVEIDGVSYFVGDGNQIVTESILYLSDAFVETPGYYTFDVDGAMELANGIIDGRYYANGALSGLYTIVTVDDASYFVSDGYVLATDCTLYLSDWIVAGTEFAEGFYTFDANGVMTAA